MGQYDLIIAALDTAIENWAGKPVSLSIGGRSITYRALSELIAARRYYAGLNATGRGFKITNLKAGGPR